MTAHNNPTSLSTRLARLARLSRFGLGACIALSLGISHATRFELQTSDTGQPFYKVALPKSVYIADVLSTSPNPTQWRVYNAAGEDVPFALTTPQATVESLSKQSNHALSLFTLTQQALQDNGNQLNLELSSGKQGASTLRLQTQSKSSAAPKLFVVKTWTPPAATPELGDIDSIQLKWKGAAGQTIALEVLASDDLQSFRTVATATVLNIKNGDDTIVQDIIIFDRPVRSKYLQLRRSTSNGEAAADSDFVITDITSRHSISVAGTAVRETLLADTLTTPTISQSPSQTFYDFQTYGRYAAQQLQLSLPQINTIATVTVFTRNSNTEVWTQQFRGSAYRLMQNNIETKPAAFTFAPHTASQWRIAVDKAGGGLGTGNPSVTLSWQPHTLVWNARGQGPFSLIVGEPVPPNVVSNGQLSATELLATQGQGSENQRLAALPVANIGFSTPAPAAPAPKAVAKPVSEPSLRWWLWGGLGAGVLLLGAMAYSLIKQNNAGNTRPKNPE